MTQFNMVNQPQGPDPKRLLLAVVATSAVLMLYSYFFGDKPVAPASEVAKLEEVKKDATPDAPLQKDENVNAFHNEATKNVDVINKSFSKISQTSEKSARTSYRAEISNHGGVISRYALLDFSDEQILFDRDKRGSTLIKISSAPNSMTAIAENAPYEVTDSDESQIQLRHVTKNGLEIVRHYQFLKDAQISEKITFKNLSASALKIEPVLSALKRDENVTEASFFNPGIQGQTIALKSQNKHQKLAYTDLVDKEKTFPSVNYVAFDDQFFLAAIVPNYADSVDNVSVVVREDKNKAKNAAIEFKLKPFVLVGGEAKSISHQLFLGPKQVDLLSSLTTPLDENIDFGWFGVLSRPMLWLLVQIYGFVLNYGLAIILITFIIKLLTYPLTQKSFSSQQEMKKLQPKIKDLQAKFGHDRTLLGQKQMELYRTHGINPLAGCLPLLIQLPIWFAFFQMLRNSVELFDQPFYFWLTDLTRPDQYFVLPVLMGVSMLVQQAFTPPPADQPQMKYVMWAMPIFLTFIMLNMPSGLSLYILTNNLLTIVQQIIIKKKSEKITA